MKITYSVLYIFLIAALAGCTVFAKRSQRQSRGAVAWLETSLMLPLFGNLIIILSNVRIITLIGHYIYFLGINSVLLALVNFTNAYCKGIGNGTQKPTVMYIGLAADSIQLLLNPFLGHAFSLETVTEGGKTAFVLHTYFGQTIHRVIDYLVLLCAILIFTLASVLTPKIYRERYTVLLYSMIAIGIMQAYYIFTESNYDRPVLGYGFFGLVLFYFAIVYRPLRLLDQMLSNIISDLSDAFYVFDSAGKCIWANEQGCKLAGFSGKNYEELSPILFAMFGNPENTNAQNMRKAVGEGENMRFYALEEKQVMGEGGKNSGSYLRIQDVTEEEREIQVRDEQIGQISKAAYKDALTGVGNKAAYNRKVSELNAMIADEQTELAVVMIDLNDLKKINDLHGHKAGDIYIKGCCTAICEAFKHSPVYRIGGDEFAVILTGTDYDAREQHTEQLRRSYDQSFAQTDKDDWLRFSASVGMSEHAPDEDSLEPAFKRADLAMYEEKKLFKQLHGSYRS